MSQLLFSKAAALEPTNPEISVLQATIARLEGSAHFVKIRHATVLLFCRL